MKKLLWIVFSVVLLLSGCTLETFEAVDDTNNTTVMAKPATILLELPEETAVPAMRGASGTLYFCGDYDIMVEVMTSGNLNSTLQTLTGFDREELNLLQTIRCGVDCYEGVWSAAGEGGEYVGRVLILDDGSYHYCVSIMSMADDAGKYVDEWNSVLQTVALSEG